MCYIWSVSLTSFFSCLTPNYDLLSVKVSNWLQLLTQRCLWCLAISEIINVAELSLSCLPVSHLNCCSVFCFCFCILLAISSFHHSSSFILGLILPSLSFVATHLRPSFCQFPSMAFLRLQTALLSETLCFSLPLIFHIWIAVMISKQEDKSGLWLSHSFSKTFSFPRIYAFPSKNVRCNGGTPSAAQLSSFYWVLVGHNILLNQSMLYSLFISLPSLLKILFSINGEIWVFS